MTHLGTYLLSLSAGEDADSSRSRTGREACPSSTLISTAVDLLLLCFCSLTPLTQKLKEAKVVYICSQLYQKLYGKEQQRDIASIALKAVVDAIANPQTAVEVVGMLAPKLTEGIQAEVSQILVGPAGTIPHRR